jgi:hypothetical protein
MALNEIHPESSSLPTTFLPAEQDGLYNDQRVLRNHQQRPHSSHHPMEDQTERFTTEDDLQQFRNLQAPLHGAGSSTDDPNNSSHQNGEVNGIRGTSEQTEIHQMACEPTLQPTATKKRRFFASMAKITGLLILGTAIAGLFSVPVALFILKANDSSAEGVCTGEVYRGDICRTFLAARQSCIPGRENSAEILVVLTESQQAIFEQGLSALRPFLSTSPECGDELLEFFCLEAGLCDPAGVIQRTSRQECERITTRTCATEFQQVLPILQGGGLDVACDTFPEESSACTTRHGHGIYLCTVTPHNHVWSIMTLVIGLIGTKTTTGKLFCVSFNMQIEHLEVDLK